MIQSTLRLENISKCLMQLKHFLPLQSHSQLYASYRIFILFYFLLSALLWSRTWICCFRVIGFFPSIVWCIARICEGTTLKGGWEILCRTVIAILNSISITADFKSPLLWLAKENPFPSHKRQTVMNHFLYEWVNCIKGLNQQ